MRKYLFYLINIENGLYVGIVNRCFFLEALLADMFFNFFGKSYIGSMSGTCGNNVCVKVFANKSQVTYHIEQFMSGGFVGKTQFEIV
ncbi:MAG: hypothetical protein BWY70_01589 [Bacteroidetes bacterium ADurb.Bin408]|nr:MAG: hypothetical protein BWY70_01589 [Bacteroidetes bacterium ADurb.Bin408]